MFSDLLMTLQPLIMGENLKEVELELRKKNILKDLVLIWILNLDIKI